MVQSRVLVCVGVLCVSWWLVPAAVLAQNTGIAA